MTSNIRAAPEAAQQCVHLTPGRAPGLVWWESARFQTVFVARSWFRQRGVISSRPPAPLGKNTFGDAARRVTQAVDCNNMCYMSKLSENAKFSRVFDDS